MPFITDYAFGKMTINDRVYTSDLIILPDGRILENWYREAGHLLTEKDLAEVIRQTPSLVIAGTGAYGRMAVAPKLPETLAKRHIQLAALHTDEAVARFNAGWQNNTDRICGCFHLTC